ncbi:MAG: prolipoprotein diacylglyceryl transferase [Epsilonproteobacteria bacterium]|nr:prolipoprotein diacylglyceryl transferase [Campylobacterota bacterium]
MEFWNHIYANFDPVAFELFSIKVHWYGLMYVTALLLAIYVAHWIVKKDKLPITKALLDSYIIWIEVGVILGARLGYILFYDPNTSYYLTHPWQIFNPFGENGEFVGIRGMSYHGAMLGFLIASTLFSLKHKMRQWFLLDIAAVAIPAGFTFGRIGNFLNQELIGRPTDVNWGIYVDTVLRHPSQLYEAILEGVIVFFILYWYRTKKRFDGELISLYIILYGLARFSAEFFREPDVQIGFVCCGWMTKGQEFSLFMITFGLILYFVHKKRGVLTR